MDLKPLITLVAIINPLAIVPFFIHYTEGFSAQQRQQTIRTAALASFCVIAACAIIGLQVLDFFNISLQSFQVGDRKSTRLNSSHLVISYAVFCLKKKKTSKIN